MAAAPIPRPAEPRPAPLRALRAAARLLGAHPVVALGLGAALILSLGAVCCGVGLLAAPWLACELMALGLGTARGHRVERHGGWLRAGVLLAVAVVVAGAAVMVAVTWLGAQAPRDPVRDPMFGAGHGEVLALMAGGSVLALLYMLPYIYAPVLLIERGGSLGGALARSASLVVRGGLGAHLAFSCACHLIQVAPPLLAAAVASVAADRSTLPLAVAASLPLMAITVPLGQSMIVASYVERAPPPDPGTPLVAPTGRPAALSLAAVSIMPAVALLLIVAAVTGRSSPASPGTAPLGEVVAGGTLGAEPRRFHIPQTGLSLRASAAQLAVEAGDGGGVGAVPLPRGVRFDRLRVVRVRDTFTVEVGAGAESYVAWVDRAGVRLDDDLPTRLENHLPPWGLPLLMLSMLASALVLSPALARVGDVGSPAQRRALWLAGALLPLHAATLGLGIAAVLS